MSGDTNPMSIARLMSTFDLKIAGLPDHLKCAKCKSVLKDACQVPCGCRFCRSCIDNVVASGDQFCPGGSEDCDKTPLSTSAPDYSANKIISRLTTKCPRTGCSHECPLADMEDHLLVCPRKSVDCPFRRLGCQQDELTVEELSDHLQRESRGHSEILVGALANMSRDMEMLRCELAQKDEQMRSMVEEMRHVENENKLIQIENKSIKEELQSLKNSDRSNQQEKRVLSDRVRLLSEKLEREIAERRAGGEGGEADGTRWTAAIGMDQNAWGTEMRAVKDDVQSIMWDIAAMKVDIDSMDSQLQSMGEGSAPPTGPVDGTVSCDEWLIDEDVANGDWVYRKNDRFSGPARSYSFQLASWNSVDDDDGGGGGGALWIDLRILTGPHDSRLSWPFVGMVTVTVADRLNREAGTTLARQCRIERPSSHHYSCSDPFLFLHSDLVEAGLDLGRGACVSCRIAPAAAANSALLRYGASLISGALSAARAVLDRLSL